MSLPIFKVPPNPNHGHPFPRNTQFSRDIHFPEISLLQGYPFSRATQFSRATHHPPGPLIIQGHPVILGQPLSSRDTHDPGTPVLQEHSRGAAANTPPLSPHGSPGCHPKGQQLEKPGMQRRLLSCPGRRALGNASPDTPGSSRTCPAALRLAQEGVQGQPGCQRAPENVRGREAEGGTRQGKHLHGKQGNILVIAALPAPALKISPEVWQEAWHIPSAGWEPGALGMVWIQLLFPVEVFPMPSVPCPNCSHS